MDEDAHLEAAYEERHERPEIDLSYTEDQEFAMEIDNGECADCGEDPSECECMDEEPGHGYWEAGDY